MLKTYGIFLMFSTPQKSFRFLLTAKTLCFCVHRNLADFDCIENPEGFSLGCLKPKDLNIMGDFYAR